eukprot:TRINITY_DN19030_c0_g1_i2.p1 TRINITY_DN19030_c0_g1~~TRINITY_DN19030_c0_g1_i2.p1  ORF type:complete len:272 (+),score=62.78 TRINITY_DN19030_c0_g1_i2:87-902(+)
MCIRDRRRVHGDYAETLNSFRTERLRQTSLINDLKEELNQLEAKTKVVMSSNSSGKKSVGEEGRRFPSEYILPTDSTEKRFEKLEEELMYTRKLLKEKEWALNNQLQINRKLTEELGVLRKEKKEEMARILGMIHARVGANASSIPELQPEELAQKAEEAIVWVAQQMEVLKKKYEVLLDKYNKAVYENGRSEVNIIPNSCTLSECIQENRKVKYKPSVHDRNSDLYYDLRCASKGFNTECDTTEYIKMREEALKTDSKVMGDISNLGICI